MSKGKIIALLIIVFLILDSIFVMMVMTRDAKAPVYEPEPLPVLYPVPEFSLTDTDGEAFGLDDLKGKVWVADFFFTSCAGPCPIMTAAMAKLQQFYQDFPDVKLVSVTVDPDTDTPERLKEYGLKYEANLDQWHFLTGPMEEIQRLAVEGMKLGSVDEPIFHSTKIVLVDRDGNIRGYYTGTERDEVMELNNAILQLLKEETP